MHDKKLSDPMLDAHYTISRPFSEQGICVAKGPRHIARSMGQHSSFLGSSLETTEHTQINNGAPHCLY